MVQTRRLWGQNSRTDKAIWKCERPCSQEVAGLKKWAGLKKVQKYENWFSRLGQLDKKDQKGIAPAFPSSTPDMDFQVEAKFFAVAFLYFVGAHQNGFHAFAIQHQSEPEVRQKTFAAFKLYQIEKFRYSFVEYSLWSIAPSFPSPTPDMDFMVTAKLFAGAFVCAAQGDTSQKQEQ